MRKSSWPATEIELAVPVIGWLREQHWTVYQEVQCERSGAVADIVAVQGKITWVIECKRSLSLALIAQGHAWTSFAHYVSLAVPHRPIRGGSGPTVSKILKHLGLGLVIAEKDGVMWELLSSPRLNRSALVAYLRDGLCAEQQDVCPAGTREGWRVTPFKMTCRELRRIVAASPGVTMKDAIGQFRHHYASDQIARSCLARWLSFGHVRGVRLEKGRPSRLWPEEGYDEWGRRTGK